MHTPEATVARGYRTGGKSTDEAAKSEDGADETPLRGVQRHTLGQGGRSRGIDGLLLASDDIFGGIQLSKMETKEERAQGGSEEDEEEVASQVFGPAGEGHGDGELPTLPEDSDAVRQGTELAEQRRADSEGAAGRGVSQTMRTIHMKPETDRLSRQMEIGERVAVAGAER